MAGPELVVKVGANIEGLRTGMAQAAAAVKTLDTTAQTVGTTLRGTGTAADHAAAKLRYLGDAGETATPKVNNLRGALGQFDGVLSAMGVKLGPEIRALGELGDASGKTASQVGKLATGGLAVGALMAGWKIGRVAADFFDLDTKIGNATAKLLGWGDVGAEVAGAKQDTINRAIQDGASATITYTEAIAFNIATQKEKAGALTVVTTHTAAQTAADRVAAEVEKAASAVIQESNRRKLQDLQAEITAHQAAAAADAHWADVMAELNSAGDGWRGTLAAMDGDVVGAIQYYLQAGVAQGTLADAYGVTAAQVRAAKAGLEANSKATDENARATQGLVDAARQLNEELERKKKLEEDEAKRRAAAEKARRDAMRTDHEQGGSWSLDEMTKKKFTEAGGENRIAMLENSLSDRQSYGGSYAGMVRYLNDQVLLAELRKFRDQMPKYADGVTDAPGGWSMVGERGPERMFVPPHANIYPNGSGGGGSSVTNIYITQPLGTPQQIYAVIDKVITDRQKQIGTRF